MTLCKDRLKRIERFRKLKVCAQDVASSSENPHSTIDQDRSTINIHRRNDVHQQYVNMSQQKMLTYINTLQHTSKRHQPQELKKQPGNLAWGRCACLHWHCCTRWDMVGHGGTYPLHKGVHSDSSKIQWLIQCLFQWFVQWLVQWFVMIFTYFTLSLQWWFWDPKFLGPRWRRARSWRSRCVCCDPFPGLPCEPLLITIWVGSTTQIWWTKTIKPNR